MMLSVKYLSTNAEENHPVVQRTKYDPDDNDAGEDPGGRYHRLVEENVEVCSHHPATCGFGLDELRRDGQEKMVEEGKYENNQQVY